MRGRARSRLRRRRSSRLRAAGAAAAKLALGFVLITALLTVSLRWITPPTTSFILQRRVEAVRAGEPWGAVEQRWVPWRRISPHLAVAVVASEDQRFPDHPGFDFRSIADAVRERYERGRVRGASTISQQVAKNLFLWPGRSWVRKALEAWFTLWIEATWPKRRILEVYLNVARFGDRTFGAAAAASRFFGKPVTELTPREAAVLAAVLPNPVRLRAADPSPYVRRRAAEIRRQMTLLGGPVYLRGL